MPTVWAGIVGRFPRSHEALRMYVRWLARGGGDAAIRFLRARFPSMPMTYDGLLLYARSHDEARQTAEADRAYELLLTQFPQAEEPYSWFAGSLRHRGELARARQVLQRAETELGACADIALLAASVRADLNEIDRIGGPGETNLPGHSSIAVLDRILRQLAAHRVA